MSPVTIADLVERNKELAKAHNPKPFFSELPPEAPKPKILIVSCVDNRAEPGEFLGLKPREAVALRTIAGHVHKPVDDIVALDAFLGFREIMLIHHTDCGGTHFDVQALRKDAKTRAPGLQGLDELTFGAISDLRQSVRDEVTALRESPLIRPELRSTVKGFLYDIKTGLLEPIV